jgi:soluble lytic murein transglycosylase-like protein
MLGLLSCGVHGPVAAPPPAEPAAIAEADPALDFVRRELDTRPTGLSEPELDALAQAIVTEARRHRLDPQLVMAVMFVESRYHAFALSPVGAMGLMQILPSTGEELAQRLGVPWHGNRTLFDPMLNVRLGVAYLRELQSQFGSLEVALAAYNWGPGHIGRRLRRGHELPTEYPRLVREAHEAQEFDPRT